MVAYTDLSQYLILELVPTPRSGTLADFPCVVIRTTIGFNNAICKQTICIVPESIHKPAFIQSPASDTKILLAVKTQKHRHKLSRT
jgi:hypothetical protein